MHQGTGGLLPGAETRIYHRLQVGFLEEKGFLQRRPIANTFLYKPAISERDYHGITISDVVNKYYDKSYSSLVLHFVEDKKMDLDELKEIIDLIENKEK